MLAERQRQRAVAGAPARSGRASGARRGLGVSRRACAATVAAANRPAQRHLARRRRRAAGSASRVSSSEEPPSWKKSSWTPTSSHAEQLLPGLGDRPLGGGPRRDVGAGGRPGRRVRRRQRGPVHLAAGGQRAVRRAARTPTGIIVSGSRSRRNARRARPATAAPGSAGTTYAASRWAPVGVDECDHRDAVHVRVRGERGLHLARLDPYAVDLDLLVAAAEELQRAVGAPAGPGHRCGRAARPGAPYGSGTNRSAVRSGPAEVAAGQPDAADVQLAGHADRHRRAVVVEHADARCSSSGRPIGTGAGRPVPGRTAARSRRSSTRSARTCSRSARPPGPAAAGTARRAAARRPRRPGAARCSGRGRALRTSSRSTDGTRCSTVTPESAAPRRPGRPGRARRRAGRARRCRR